jgi:hypothetical protein
LPLLDVYAESEQENLSGAECKAIALLIAAIETGLKL